MARRPTFKRFLFATVLNTLGVSDRIILPALPKKEDRS